MIADDSLLLGLTPLHRLALAYAPAASRGAWLGFLALDMRLAAIVRAAREPMIGQIKLAWWRERLRGRDSVGIRIGVRSYQRLPDHVCDERDQRR